MEKVKLYVRFVMAGGEVLAVFMRSNAGVHFNPHTGLLRSCYAHMGQHGTCVNSYSRKKRATPKQYAPLLKELKSIGYDPIIVM